MNLRAIAAVAALSLAAACAPVDDVEGQESTAESVVLREGVRVDARYRSVFQGTPTYGSQPTAMLTLNVAVNDAQVRRGSPGFDGFEAPFALVPRAEGGRVLWETVALRYAGTGLAGYYGQEREDRYELGAPRRIDLATVRRLGIAVGLETNVGRLWAQRPGQNFAVRPADAR